MQIAILGAGAMGSLFGAYLSQNNHVCLIDVNEKRVDDLKRKGVSITEKDQVRTFHPDAVCDSTGMPVADVIVVFVKAMFTEQALETNRRLIGPDTYLISFQNGAGHQEKLGKFADAEHVVLGTTQHNSSILPDGGINHGGGGHTFIGLQSGNCEKIQHIADAFTACGIETQTAQNIGAKIWEKLFVNTAASSLTGLLQVPLGFIEEDAHACSLMEKLAQEAVLVANAETGAGFQAEKVIADIKTLLRNAKGGYTSIYADLRDGRHSEVDPISGAVVAAARRHGIQVPFHEAVVATIHAMEDRNDNIHRA